MGAGGVGRARLMWFVVVCGVFAGCAGLAGCGGARADTCARLPAGEVNGVLGLDDARGSAQTSSESAGPPQGVCVYKSANGLVDAIAVTADYPAGSDLRQDLAAMMAADGSSSLPAAPAPEAGPVAVYFETSKGRPCVASAQPGTSGPHTASVCVPPGLHPTHEQMVDLLHTLLATTPPRPRDTRCAEGQTCVPVRMATIPGTSNGRRALVDVSVGGGPQVPVMLDTGSQGLRLDPGAIGPEARPTDIHDQATGPTPVRIDSVGVQASVTIGTGQHSVTTASPVLVGSITSAADAQSWTSVGARGILGIGLTPTGVRTPLRSPLAQLPPPHSDGYTLSLPDDGSTDGALSLGRPARSAHTLVLPMLDQTPTHGIAEIAVTLCWTIAENRTCGPTLLDTGDPSMLVSSHAVPTAPHTGPNPNQQIVTEGTPVTISTPTGNTLMDFRSTLLPLARVVRYSSNTGTTPFAASIGLFTAGTTAVDIPAHEMLFTPNRTS